MATKERTEILLKIAILIQENAEALALIETYDTGKPIDLSKTVDIPVAVASTKAVQAAFANQGQICLCNSRILI